MTPTAHFASLRSNLLVVEKTAQPVFSNGKQIGQNPGVYHTFAEHRCRVQGQKSIDYVRARAHASDGPGIWELDATDVPEVTELLAEMAIAPVDRVREILADEEAGPRRQVILETCSAVLQRAGVSVRRPGERATVTA
jgi:hypothetical protein